MVHSPSLYIAVLSSILTSAVAGETGIQLPSYCQEIAHAISGASAVYDPLSINYLEDISHWASSSTQFAACSFEPGTAEDVGIALQILGRSRTPFAVKGGGHNTNPGFSSTLGVQITMSRFSEITYNSTAQTVTVGAGLVWDDVYAALEPYGVNVVGGKATGVGVAGLSLGGGFSWLSNQYGLTVDTVQAYELVLPNGTVTNVTDDSNPDLFFALKGCLNNFGIVTRITLKTFPQTLVWGGFNTYSGIFLNAVNTAVANFITNNNDPKAAIIISYNCVLGLPGASLFIFYNAPSRPEGTFDELLAIPTITKDISTRSFLSLVQSGPSNATYGTRAVFDYVPVTDLPLPMLQSLVNESIYWGNKLALESGILISYDVEPMLSTYISHNTMPSAYPASRAQAYLPIIIYYAWILPTNDTVFQNAAQTSANTLKEQAISMGQNIVNAPIYPNDAIFDTPLTSLYGDNLPRLQEIKALVDPDNVMGLAGGFKL